VKWCKFYTVVSKYIYSINCYISLKYHNIY